MYHNMHKTALKQKLFVGVVYVHGGSVHILLFRYVTDNWNWLFVIGIFEV